MAAHFRFRQLLMKKIYEELYLKSYYLLKLDNQTSIKNAVMLRLDPSMPCGYLHIWPSYCGIPKLF